MSAPAHFTLQWVEPGPIKIPEALRQAVAGPELLLQTLVRRGYDDPQSARAFLFPDEYQPTPATELPGMEKAIQRIQLALKKKEKIGIWGDFDVDGQTSTSILVAGLRKLGAEVAYHIPIRESESHGILLEPLKAFLQLGVSLLITCDTGISANEPIAYAMQSGVDVIVTDHHTLPESLPAAFAIVDPQLVDLNHPLRTLSGSGVAYKVMEQLFSEMDDPTAVTQWVDLAAFGLVADLATLRGDARYLVQRGLEQMRSHPRPAFDKIFSDNNIAPQQVNEETLSFVLAPRLNAVGRLADANPMVEFLLSEDPVAIAPQANLIEGLNNQRKLLCDQVFRGALAQIEQNPKLLDSALLLLAHPGWPGGVVGIVASRLVELYHRPAILMNIHEGIARGSARSIEGVNITQALVENKALLTTFGGHPMAAGMATTEENIDLLRRGLSRSVARMLEEAKVQPSLEVDAVLELGKIDLDLMASLNQMAPYGPGNPPLQFMAKELELIDAIPFGKTREHLQMITRAREGTQYSIIWWQGVELPRPENRFDLAFKTSVNTFKGKVEVRFEWVDFRETASESEKSARKRKIKQLIHLDFRKSTHPEEDIQSLLSEQPVMVWGEGQAAAPLQSYIRTQLSPAQVLVLWTPPPSPGVLQQALDIVKPQKLCWFNNLPQETELKELIRSGYLLIKSGLAGKEEALFSIEEIAAKLATTGKIALMALAGFQAQGQLVLAGQEGDSIRVQNRKTSPSPDRVSEIQAILISLQREVTAYRELYARAPLVSQLLPDAYKAEK